MITMSPKATTKILREFFYCNLDNKYRKNIYRTKKVFISKSASTTLNPLPIQMQKDNIILMRNGITFLEHDKKLLTKNVRGDLHKNAKLILFSSFGDLKRRYVPTSSYCTLIELFLNLYFNLLHNKH